MARKKTTRDEELSTRARVHEKLLEIFSDVDKGFQDQRERADLSLDYWDLYNCKLGAKQFYNGNSKIFLPIVKNAIKARKTRFVNQLFPQSGRYVEVITENGDIPHATMALLDFYVRAAKLRTQVMPALMVAGDVEGQYSVYVGWGEIKRHTVRKIKKPVEISGLEFPEIDEVDDIEENEVVEAGPTVEVIPDADLLILPATCDSVDQALEEGGSVSIIRRWTKAKLKTMIAEGEIEKEAGDAITKQMSRRDTIQYRDTKKALADAAGIRAGAGGKYCHGYETWTKIKVDGKLRLVRAYYGGDDQVLGCKINPYWCDKVPVLSAPVEKSGGIVKGRSPCADVIDTQIFANDTINEGADTAHFAAMPIIMTDPEKNPRVGSMVLGLASVWETSPQSTQFAKFPELWKDAFEIVAACKNEIFQTLAVNPSMVPQGGSRGGKQNQAEIANQQQVDILTTADAVTNIEEQILTPLLQRFAEYDHQFREDAITVKQFGEMGLRAKMEEIPPLQMNRRYEFRWFGVEAARNAAQIQQQIAMANVFKGIPPQLYQGYKFDMAPLMVHMAESAFGPRLAPLIFKDLKSQLSVSAKDENEMLMAGFDLAVSPLDNDIEHMQEHMQAMAMGDQQGTVRVHLMRHQQQMAAKQAQQAQQQGLPGSPGGDGQSGVAGTPQAGAQPAIPRQMKGPPGMIPPDRMGRAGAVTMPRKT